MQTNDSTDPVSCAHGTTSYSPPSRPGNGRDASSASEPQEDTVGTSYPPSPASSPDSPALRPGTATVASPQRPRSRIWIDRLNSCAPSILVTLCSRILDQASTSRERAFKPWWTPQFEAPSAALWFPTETDSLDWHTACSRTCSDVTPAPRSWFSIRTRTPVQSPNWLRTSSPSSPSSPVESTAEGATESDVNSSSDSTSKKLKQETQETAPKKPKKPPPKLKTIRMRLFPTPDQETDLKTMFDQYRWYYNAGLNVLRQVKPNFETDPDFNISFYWLRDLFSRFKYSETTVDGVLHRQFQQVDAEEKQSYPVPPWWSNAKVPSRVWRGAIKKLVTSVKSAKSNLEAGNNRGFTMRFRSKKNDSPLVYFEDSNGSKFLNAIHGVYWFRPQGAWRSRKRAHIGVDGLPPVKDFTIKYCPLTEHYYLLYTVNYTWFPAGDGRSEIQVQSGSNGNRVIALDPGVRKFMVGYDPSGLLVTFGERAAVDLATLLLQSDSLSGLEKRRHLKRAHDMVTDLHWRTISYLVKNYDTIVLPDFPVQRMVRGRKLPNMVKRQMLALRFYDFRMKLDWRCRMEGRKLVVTTEEYTSKTCGRCGLLNNNGSAEWFRCRGCGLQLDRDANGARNIYLKTLGLTLRPGVDLIEF